MRLISGMAWGLLLGWLITRNAYEYHAIGPKSLVADMALQVLTEENRSLKVRIYQMETLATATPKPAPAASNVKQPEFYNCPRLRFNNGNLECGWLDDTNYRVVAAVHPGGKP